MLEGFILPSLELITVPALYILLVLMLLFERVVPIGRVRAEEKRTEYWQTISEKKDATINQQAETIEVLAEGVGETVAKVMGELQTKAGDKD